MKQLTFTLEQHTPMLHFHASQQGATLRATDVKPRFDRWLIEKVWKNDFDECCSFLVGYDRKFSEDDLAKFKKKFAGGYRALNYKMSIIAQNPVEVSMGLFDKIGRNGVKKYETYKYPGKDKILVLSNMGGKENKEDLHNLIRYEDIELNICCFDPVLAKFIEDKFPIFIYQSSFGSRGRKGFGHFTVEKINGQNYSVGPVSGIRKMMSLEIMKNKYNNTDLNYSDAYKDIYSCIFIIDKTLKRIQERKLKKCEKQLLGIGTEWRSAVPKHLPSPIILLPVVKPAFDNKGSISKFKVDIFYRLDVDEIAHVPFKSADDQVCAEYNALMKMASDNFRPYGCTYFIRKF